MDKSGAVSISNRNSAQRKFFQWVGQWFYTGQAEDICIKPDAPELACFLQAIGFRLREFERQEDNNGNNGTKNDTLKIIIECGSSKMRAVMELEDVRCQCPNQDDAKDASFWSVSGTAPLGSMENMSKVLETGSNLLPPINKGVTNVIRDVTHHLFKLIKNIPDPNQNADSNASARECSLKPPSNAAGIPFMRRHTESDFNSARCRSLDTLTKSNEAENDEVSKASLLSPRNRSCSVSLHKPQETSNNKLILKEDIGNINLVISTAAVSPPCIAPLQRQKTFDMDIECSSIEGEPRPSPPKISSSPVPMPQLCMSLGQISLQSEGRDLPFIDFLFKAKANLEHALLMLSNSPHGSNANLDDIFLKPDPPKNSLKISPGNNSRPGSSCSLPIQPASRNVDPHRSSVRRNVATSFRKSFDGTKLPTDNKSTPTSRTLLQRRSFGGRLPSPKPVKEKVDTPRPGTSGIKSDPLRSRTIVTVKRRVSPIPKTSSSEFSRHNASLNTSGLKTLAVTNKLESNIASPKTLPGSTANKFGFIKKKA
ncbi:uncharacterized protein LOC124310451 isoform X1 [Neodiprion virginianus]|uniref:uncharacterized protein LOC124310451 isoform X1 n=1 Tax=Neodiprion virginianus TaxID=2961670 RepID=UPI001EE70608|nr:uncharacterized protein LOC124310451 isoform X1 [Neodiprion virginianus]